MAKQNQSLVARTILALVLMIGYYLLAVAIVGLLLFVIYLEIIGGRFSLYITLLCLFAAGVIVWSILPRVERFQAPGPRLEEEKNPLLFSEIETIARETQQKMPSEVYLVNEANAFVAQRGGFAGIGGKQVMGIGLPLLSALSVPQLRAILAHEFGHYYGGDTRLGPLIFRTRNMVIRTVGGLQSDNWFIYIIRLPFVAYAKLFLRITQATSRAQEYGADRLAARVAGTQNTVTALSAIHGVAPAWESFWINEYAPLLSRGFAPPLADGFNQYLKAKTVTKNVTEIIEKEAQNSRTDPYDSHPSLKDRIAALQEKPDPAENNAKTPALDLVPDISELETQLFKAIAEKHHLAAPQAVSWDEISQKVYLPSWQDSVSSNTHILKGQTPENLPQVALKIDQLAALASGESDMASDQRERVVFHAFGSSLSLALLQRGWQIDTSPGEALLLVKDKQKIDCFEILKRLQSGDLSAEAWVVTCRSLGINGLDLAETGKS